MIRSVFSLAVLAVVLAGSAGSVAEAQNSPFVDRFIRDVEKARRDFRRKMGVGVRVERAPQRQARTTPRGPVIRRDSGLVATSLRPAARPGEEIAAQSGPSAAEQRLEAVLGEAVASGELAPEIAQVIRAGAFPTRAELEARAAGLGNGWLPGGAKMALRGTRVTCEDGGTGGCDKVASDPALADVREEVAVIEAQAEAVRVVAGLPRLVAAMAELADERARTEAAQARDYPVARGDALPSIDSLLDSRGE